MREWIVNAAPWIGGFLILFLLGLISDHLRDIRATLTEIRDELSMRDGR